MNFGGDALKELKVCFIGIGSIAKRHIKNLKKICNQDGICLTIDAVRRKECRDEEEIRTIYTAIDQIKEMYDVIFITNPTNCHMESLKKAAAYGRSFFIEKPLAAADQIGEAETYKEEDGKFYYVACPLRYNAVIQYIKDKVKPEDVISVRSISSSYLPEWRAGVDYRSTYSAHRSMGGGVSVDLIHEWDYLTYLFGKPIEIKSFQGKKSGLEIDSEDYAIYIAEYSDKVVELHLDYFGRKTMREITLFTGEETIVGDIVNHTVTYLKRGETITFCEERDDYQIRELRYFLNMIRGEKQSECGLRHAIDVLKISQGVLA